MLKRNAAYSWAPAHMKHQGPGYVEQVLYRFIPEHQTRLAALEKGEIDVIGRAPGPDVARLREDKRFAVALNMFKGAPTMFLVSTGRASSRCTGPTPTRPGSSSTRRAGSPAPTACGRRRAGA